MKSNLSGKKVLVTGASGFIGIHLIEELNKLNCQISCVSLNKVHKNQSNWYQVDLTSEENVNKLFEQTKPDYVFNLASLVTGSRDSQYVMPTIMNNFISTIHILETSTKHKVKRIILAGSMEETEVGEKAPSSPYAASKDCVTLYAKMYQSLYQAPVVVARLFMVYGPNQKDEKKIIPYVIKTILEQNSPRFSSGKRKVDWIYVEDVVKGLIACAEKSNIEGKIFDIGTGKYTSVRTFVTKLASLMNFKGKLLFGSLPDRKNEIEKKADVLRTTKELGWQPTIDITSGLTQTIDWYKKNQKTYE